MTNIKFGWGVTFICLAAFLAITVLAAKIFEHVPHSEDEVAYLFQAKIFAQNRITVPTPPNDYAFWTPFVIDYEGARFGKYPPGWPLLLSIGVRLGAPWLTNAGLAVLSLAIIAYLGKKIYSAVVGLWAAGLGLIAPGFLFLSSSLFSHTATLFWIVVALLALAYLVHSERNLTLYAIGLGIALGMIFITRPFDAIVLGLPIGVFLLVLLIRQERPWTIVPGLILSGLSTSALLPLFWWELGGSPTFNPYLEVWPYDRVGFGPDIGPKGYTPHTAFFVSLPLRFVAMSTGLFGWPLWTNLIFLPLPFLFKRANRWDVLLLGTIGSVIFIYLFYWEWGRTLGGFPRYYYAALPALLLLTARGILLVTEYLTRWRPSYRHIPLILIICFTLYSFIWRWPPLLADQKGKYGITPEPLEIIEQAQLPEPALVIVKNIDDWTQFATLFVANSPTLDTPIVYAIDWGPELNARVVKQFADRTCWEMVEDQLFPCSQ